MSTDLEKFQQARIERLEAELKKAKVLLSEIQEIMEKYVNEIEVVDEVNL